MTTTSPRHPDRLRHWLIGLEIALVLNAVGGAVALITFGAGMPDDIIDRLPFGSAVLGGAALLLVNGVLPATVAIGAGRRRPWAVPGHLVVGAALMGWVVVQVGFIGVTSFLQPVLFAWGALILGLGAWNRHRLHAASEPGSAATPAGPAALA